MANMININFRNLEVKKFQINTSLEEISKKYQKHFNYPILIGQLDNDIVELSELVSRSHNIDFFDRSSTLGNSVYGTTLQFLVILGAKRAFGDDAEVLIEHSMDKGFYCEILKDDFSKENLKKLEKTMKEIVKENLEIDKLSVSRLDAIKYFETKKQFDKVKVLKYISNTYINLYKVDDTYDYFYGKLASKTGVIDDFKLTYIENNGFVVSYPSVYNPECTLDYIHHGMLFDKFLDYTRWGRKIKISNGADLNEVVSKGKYNELIHIAETHYDSQLSKIADKIEENKNIRLVLISGPSSSGKTTSSKKLSIQLKSRGINTYPISIDDYFLDRDKTPKDKNGKLDTESLKAVDVTLFNKHLTKLLSGDTVELPEYNFVTGKREYNGRRVKLEKGDIIVIEGLHGLNEELTMSIDRKQKYKIYISPLTQLNIDNHNRIHTSDTRKLRRIVRDNRSRGHNASQTLAKWKEIREGEENYIFPYQDEADVILNSALVYEIGVLKTYVEPLLFNVDEKDPMYPEAIRLINLLRNFLPIPSEDVPKDSLLREFIGGSSFE